MAAKHKVLSTQRCMPDCMSHHRHERRISLQWAPINEGALFSDRISGQTALSLLDWYASRHRQASADEWRGRIEGGQCSVNGEPCADPGAPVP